MSLTTCPACGYVTVFAHCPICSRDASYASQAGQNEQRKLARRARRAERKRAKHLTPLATGIRIGEKARKAKV